MELNEFAVLQLLEAFSNDTGVMSSKYSSDTVQVADQELSVNVVIEFLEKQDEDKRYHCGVRVELAVNGLARPELTVGGLGLGEDEADAVSTAIIEWVNLHGGAVVRWLARAEGRTDILETAAVYLGRTGFRDSSPSAWEDTALQTHRAVLTAVWPHCSINTRSPIAIDVIVSVHDTEAEHAIVRIDADPSPAAARAVAALSFPAGRYLLKQFYLVCE
ncbi:MAG: hypothetical protein AAGL69_14860 [Pseudomonadota bacterium]